jgi:hypothetical protein
MSYRKVFSPRPFHWNPLGASCRSPKGQDSDGDDDGDRESDSVVVTGRMTVEGQRVEWYGMTVAVTVDGQLQGQIQFKGRWSDNDEGGGGESRREKLRRG